MKTVRDRGVTDDKKGTDYKSAPAGENVCSYSLAVYVDVELLNF